MNQDVDGVGAPEETALHKPSHVFLRPPRVGRVYSSPGPLLYVIVVGIPSLLLTAAVCGFLFASLRSFNRGQIARGSVFLLAALVPFVWFGVRTVQANLADREQASFMASISKSGPVATYPNVLVVNWFFPDIYAARLMLASDIREVDAAQVGPKGSTFSLAQTDECRKVLRGWLAKGAELASYYPAVHRCVSETKWDRNSPPQRYSALVLVRNTSKISARGKGGLELRIRDGGKEVLLDYWEEPYSNWPVFPLLVSVKDGFETRARSATGPTPDKIVLRNLKRGVP